MSDNHEELVIMYIKRDCDMKLNCTELILSNIKKLGYYNLNISTEVESIIQSKFRATDISTISDISYNEYKTSFKDTNEYRQILTIINSKIERSIKLSKYIGTDNNKDFYGECTLEELNYLGY